LANWPRSRAIIPTLLGWGKVEITIWTHAVDGLTESDFILAAKIDQLLNAFRTGTE
jgi:4a-hydroxytetrahydrobiopterin dehydratase